MKVTFLNGASLRPVPPGSGKDPDSRWIDIHAGEFDEEQMAAWFRQSAALPGWPGFWHPSLAPERRVDLRSTGMKRILYVYDEGDFHVSESAGRLIGEDLAGDGRYELEMTTDLDAFAALPRADYAAVVVYTTGCRDEFNTQNLNRRYS